MKAIWISLFAGALATAAYAESVTVNSSASATYLANGTSTSTDFSAPFTAANFSAAQSGPNAAVLNATPSYRTAAALASSGAQWIGTSSDAGTSSSSGYTALYAVSFNLSSVPSTGAFTLNYEVDNSLGSASNPGVYLNGIALPGSGDLLGNNVLTFNSLQTYTVSNVGSDLVQGTNWLYIDAVNLGGPGGLIFSANVTTATPEPSAVALLGAGLLVAGLAALSRLKSNPATKTL